MSEQRALDGWNAIVSGGASGIGRATAVRFAREGARVMVVDRDLDGAEKAVAEIRAAGGQAVARLLDVTSEEGWAATMEAAEKGWGGAPDVVVCAAGIAHSSPVAETTLEQWRRVMAVNLDGCFLGLRAAVRAMKGRVRPDRMPSIVLVSSASGRRSTPGAAAYSASKAAVTMLARSAALELAADGIRVNAVSPGAVRTPLWEAVGFFKDLVAREGSKEKAWAALEATSPGPGQKRFAAPEEIAEGILYLVRDTSRFVTGADLVMDGGFSA
jgi:NAD(P)-dependent dehydrogenase (short-subunit alcohol dehydrogenase family)